MSHDLVDDLRAEIAKGHVLVVVGAGVSIGATGGNPLASWQGLLENGVEECVKLRGLSQEWADRVRAEIKSGDMDDLLSAAEKISSKLGFPDGGEYRRWLRETVGGLRAEDRSVLKALRDLGLPLATTNYDGLLEEITALPPVTWREGDRVARAIRKDEPGILHLHGYWEDPESVVLGIRSYERILGHAHAQAVLRAVQTLHTLLFVGCGEGLTDPNFGALLQWAREIFQASEDRHYRLCLDGEAEDLRQQHKNDRLYPVPYGSDHSKLLKFLQDLKPPASTGKPREDATPLPPAAAPRASRLPGRPRCFGREDEVRDLVETLLQPSPPPTPILGGPGSGKTTITLEALYDRRVAERFGLRRFFVRCDGTASREALVGEIARAVGIEPGSNPEASLFQALEAGPAVLALDNAETPWEAATTSVEDLISALSSVEGLALVASIRGDQRPLGPPWRSSIRVGPLGLPAAREAFLAVAGESFRDDTDLDRLVEAVDRLALAIVLLAHEAEAEPNLSGLWKRWQEKRTALLKHADGKERLTNIEVSLDLSLNGPRMTPEAKRLLALLALLPDGVSYEDLNALLPGEAGEAAAVLRKVGLAFDQSTRLRALAPIREYVQRKHAPEAEDLDRAIDYYVDLASQGDLLGRPGGAEASIRLVQELGNLDSMISKGLERADPEPAILAAQDLGEFTRFTGWGSRDLLEKAIVVTRSSGRRQLEAECAEQLGNIAMARSEYDAARIRFEEALSLYRNVGDAQSEADCIWSLGEIAHRCSDHDAARARFEEALPLFRKIGDVLGEADCIRSLGDVALERSDHDMARARLEEALPLFRNVGAVLGEANCIHTLGEVALDCSDYDTARARFEEALPLFRNIGVVLGEANCIQALGEVALARSEHDTARTRFEESLPLCRNCGDVLGEANCIQGLGDIALLRSDLETASANFTEALSLYVKVQKSYSIGWAYVRLARLTLDGSKERQSHLRAAQEAWKSIKRPDLVERLLDEFGEIP